MSQEPKTERRCWTFLVQSTHSIGSSAYITGWFVFHRIAQEGAVRQTTGVEELNFGFIHLTPFDRPVTLDVSQFLDARAMEDISPGVVVDALGNLFSTAEFKPIPPRPAIEIPEGRTPPSVREKMMAEHAKIGNNVIKGSMRG